MNSDDDLTKLSDPDFLAERRRVREEMERTPEVTVALAARHQRLNEEFPRRAVAS
jgi:hypothetical protein